MNKLVGAKDADRSEVFPLDDVDRAIISEDGDVRVAAALVAELVEAEYVLITAGRFDVLAEVLCEDNAALLALVNDWIRSIDGVASTEVFSILKMEKLTFSWGTG